MNIENIKHDWLKEKISMIYLFEENNNTEMIENTDTAIKKYLSENEFIVSIENSEMVKIPYGNDGNYVIPIFTDLKEYNRGMEYYELNKMNKNKDYSIRKLKKIDNPNFLGYLINMASVSYITCL